MLFAVRAVPALRCDECLDVARLDAVQRLGAEERREVDAQVRLVVHQRRALADCDSPTDRFGQPKSEFTLGEDAEDRERFTALKTALVGLAARLGVELPAGAK